MRALILVVSCLTLAWACAYGQAGNGPVFEVASVKPAGPFVPGAADNMRGGPGTGDPGRVTFPRVPLTLLLMRAYDVWADQILGPEWFTGAEYMYTITATMPPDTTNEQFRLMLQNLLAERFHLRLHHETQTRPGYELVVASGGPKLKEWTPATDAAPGQPGLVANGFPRLASNTGRGMSMTMSRSGGMAPVRMTFRESMAGFCRALGAQINRSNGTPLSDPQPRVVDKTGLTGIYEFTLEFAGTTLLPGMMPPAPPADDAGVPAANDPAEGAPNIFTAVEKQLGLKLQKVKDVPVDVLVIDNADKVPTEN
ncbi:MAG: TIGR03435 family protein [Bryobacteraceae bacterium]|jgi:uncharacterized protein (TIGR03435 family)